MSESLLLNDQSWRVFPLAEEVLLLQFEGEADAAPEAVHALLSNPQLTEHPQITDLVAGYNSLALYFDADAVTAGDLTREISRIQWTSTQDKKEAPITEIPVCYELGTDWEEVEGQTGLSRSEIIKMHAGGEYKVAFVGFMPGFVYLDGLHSRLHCRRKEHPDTRVPAGAVGIGGMFTGIYSRPSPGGWQIIGRTPFDLFDAASMPPLKVQAGSRIRFRPVSEADFNKLKQESHED